MSPVICIKNSPLYADYTRLSAYSGPYNMQIMNKLCRFQGQDTFLTMKSLAQLSKAFPMKEVNCVIS